VYELIGFFEALSVVGGKKEKKKEHVGSNDRVHVTQPPNPVDESYYPAYRAAGGPFPVGKRKERKKADTFRRGESGQTDL
jgi:hypothetical protein